MASSRGLGKAIAEEFVANGARVVITSRSESNLQDAKENILASQNVDDDDVLTKVCDLTDEDSIRESIQIVAEECGGLDALVNNHGGPEVESFETATVEDLDQTYYNVVRSMFLVSKTAMPYLLEDDGGAVANIISASAQEPSSSNLLSNMFRTSLYGLSRTLSDQYADQGVRINAVCPRGIMTDRIVHKVEQRAEREGISYEEAYQQRTDAVPMDRLGKPVEFARVVAFLCSDQASFITGSTLAVDGGWLRRVF
jgi:3-oxoacyl-[acyl-carrier protein] reductase